jgi:hypothetical protein
MPPQFAVKLALMAGHLRRHSIWICSWWLVAIPISMASNPPLTNDIPEEVLRAEIITEARSPIDGKALSATDFAELIDRVEQQLDQDDAVSATKNPKIKNILMLLRLRGFLRSVGVPIK